MPSNQTLERRRIVFAGRVQGVGFRATARSVARAHPVTGWVRNEPDGTVLVEVQGVAGAVEGYLAALREQLGRLITRESPMPAPVDPSEDQFEVRR
jgi:acylphosphatase